MKTWSLPVRPPAKVPAGLDIVHEIMQSWGIDRTKVEVSYVPCWEEPRVVERLDRLGHLGLEVRGPPEEHDTLIFHEGAHVYLAQLGYPPLNIVVRPEYVAELGEARRDMINEYYAERLRLDKMETSPEECIEELNYLAGGEYDSTTDPVRIAIWTQLMNEYDPIKGRNAIDFAKNYGDDFEQRFNSILAVLRQAPQIPQSPNEFTKSDVSIILRLLRDACVNIYDGKAAVELIRPDSEMP
jgi:hypothetical protein